MGGPIIQNFFGLFSFMVICFSVENLYIISADSKENDGPNSPPTNDAYARMFHITFTIEGPYQEDYSNFTSLRFGELAEKIRKALKEICNPVPGNHHVSVNGLRKTRFPNQIRVITEIGSTETKGDDLEKAISKQINAFQKVGDFIITNPEDFSFLEYGVPLPGCTEGQLKCVDGQCIDDGAMKRCDHFLDCNDGSDEEGCNNATSTSTTKQPDTTTKLPVTTSPSVIDTSKTTEATSKSESAKPTTRKPIIIKDDGENVTEYVKPVNGKVTALSDLKLFSSAYQLISFSIILLILS